MTADALPSSAAVPAVGAVRKSADVWHSSHIVSPNSDDKRPDSPFPATETKTAYRVRRSPDTDGTTGQPFCELWNGSDRIAHFVPGRPDAIGAMQTIQKSMFKPWGAMAHGEAIDLHPAIVITLPRGAMGRSDVSVSVRQAAFRDDIERDTDKRKRGLYACECLAKTLNVPESVWRPIEHKYVGVAAEMDLEAALAEIRAVAETTDTTIHPNIDGALAVVEDYKGKAIAVDTTKEMKEKLDEAFGEKHWSADGGWRAAVKAEREKYRLSAAMTSDEFSKWLHKIFDVKSLKELSMTPQAALGIIADTLKQEFGAKPTPAETHAVDAASVPAAPTEATPVPSTPNGATAGKAEPVNVPSTVAVAELPEAPFSANFKLVNKLGVDVQFTIRAATVSEGVKRVEASIEHLMEQGWTTQRNASQPMQNAQTGGSTAPASNGNKGTAVCSLIKVGKSYTGNKPQLQFECDGFDRTLNYTRDPLVNILKDVQHNGKPFTADALTDGKKFGGEWLVDWDKTEKDGKTYLNVLAVRPAA